MPPKDTGLTADGDSVRKSPGAEREPGSAQQPAGGLWPHPQDHDDLAVGVAEGQEAHRGNFMVGELRQQVI